MSVIWKRCSHSLHEYWYVVGMPDYQEAYKPPFDRYEWGLVEVAKLANLRGTIRNWKSDGNDGIWVQDTRNKWYYAKFMAPCIGLPFAEGVRVKTGPSGEVDRWSSVITHSTGPCRFASFVRSDGPPPKAKGIADGRRRGRVGFGRGTADRWRLAFQSGNRCAPRSF